MFQHYLLHFPVKNILNYINLQNRGLVYSKKQNTQKVLFTKAKIS